MNHDLPISRLVAFCRLLLLCGGGFFFVYFGGFAQAATYVIPDGDVAALISALESAQNGDVIELAEDGLYTLVTEHNVLDGRNGLPVITAAIAIEGHGATIQRDSEAPDFRIFYFSGVGPQTALSNVTIKRGNSTTSGGGIYNWESSPTFINCVFSLNRTEEDGGGMANIFNSSPIISGCIFEDNWARADGGGMSNRINSHPNISETIFRGNVAQGNGGGMSNIDSSPAVTNSVFRDNWGSVFGGGMANDNSQVTVSNSEFSGNWADDGGGMANLNGSHPSLVDCGFTSNRASVGGGGISNTGGSDAVLTGITFFRNKAAWGGGVYNHASDPAVTNCDFEENEVDDPQEDGGGAGMANLGNSNPTVTGGSFIGNKTDFGWGGGMYNSGSGPTIKDVVFSGNRADGFGGGMYNINSHPSVENCQFVENFAMNRGGGIANVSSNSIVVGSSFVDNEVNDEGGGIYNRDSSPVVTGCQFQSNSADDGAGMYNRNSQAEVTNCDFGVNFALWQGGGISNVEGSQTEVIDCAFEKNSAGEGGGGIFSEAGTSCDVGSTLFCENDPDAIAGPWNDLGLNQFGNDCDAPPAGTYEGWVYQHFEEGDREDEMIAGVFASPAGDGIANLMKYALGLDPWKDAVGALPAPEFRTFDGQGDLLFLTLSFSHPSGLSDVQYEIQLSEDLVDWVELAVLAETEDDGVTVTRTYRDAEPRELSDRKFMRLRVSR